MALRAEKRTGALLSFLLAAPVMFAQQSFQYQVRHRHSPGALTINETGVSFVETYKPGKAPKHPHNWQWSYQDIQQLTIAPESVTVLTYQDNKWKLGGDRKYEFDLASGKTFEEACDFLKTRLDQRFVAAMGASPAVVLWEMPVKHALRFGGDEGVLRVGAGEIIYQSAKKNASRTWRYQDIDNISTSGPFQLTITTFERARAHYGNRKEFNFVLKQRLEEARYDDLWLRLNGSKGLQILTSYREVTGER